MQENFSSLIIEVKDLVKNFKKIEAVKGITFSVLKGESFAFLGPNGAGKTTTIRILTTLLDPTSGSVVLNGFNVHEKPNEARHSFGIVFQDPSLDTELTAYENMYIHAVLYGLSKSVYLKRIEDLMKLVDLWERRDDLVKNFSGGMKRRLEIARGLLHHPKVLFLDEPTLGLDPQTRNHMWNYIKGLREKEGLTVFFTTHYMEEADKNADRIAIIDHGVIVAQGKSDELKLQTNTKTLEDAFLVLTGDTIRDSSGGDGSEMMKMWHGKR
ncbi:MAG: ATP-binding cassette domain-containing protein [Candidatus Paceibacterota bacterium]